MLKGVHWHVAAGLLVPLAPEPCEVGFEALVEDAQARSAADGAHGLLVSSKEASWPPSSRVIWHRFKSAARVWHSTAICPKSEIPETHKPVIRGLSWGAVAP